TFRPINALPFAKVFPNGKIEELSNHEKKSGKKAEADTRFETKIALLKAYPGSDPSIIEWYLSKGFRGLVIEATGLGHVPTSTPEKERSWTPYIRMATEKGVPVVFAAQTLYGSLNMHVYKNQRLALQAGAIDGKDMLP
ncbi:MAG: Glu-tRNA(Gln) amidotransferase GatDE subunit D, partial [Candidatus Aenigmarchaeota archaeon]|nr:Glu-tRNA(Gln) amidotransferase GatDE subunit D [Candidatus Aenigmarchaeota archaeon]